MTGAAPNSTDVAGGVTDRQDGAASVTVIKPTRGWRAVDLQELWRYRELVYFLAWRDVKVRYKQTALGAAWAVLQPISTMLLFYFVFRRLANVSSNGVHYALFAFSALLPWQFFANSMNHAGLSLVENRHILTKVYFPRLVFPVSATLPGLLDLGISLVVLALMMVWYRQIPTVGILLVPAFLALAIATSVAMGLWWAALNVRYRDVRYTMPLITQLWLLASPVGYPISMVPEKWRTLYDLNPMAGVVEGFRWAVVGGPPPRRAVALSLVIVGALLASGLAYFSRTERTVADTI